MIRKRLPKKYDFKDVSELELSRIESKINKKPRKLL